MKNYLLILAAFTLIIVPSASAQQSNSADTTTGKLHGRMLPIYKTDRLNSDKLSSATSAGTQKIVHVDELKTKADGLITVRITSLTTLLTRVQGDKHLTDAEKAATTTDIQTTITGLTNLKTKIDADTTAQAIRADAKKIFSDFRIFAVYEPKTRYLVMIDTMQQVSATISSVLTRVQTYVASKKDVGVNTSEAEALLADAQNQLTTINTTLTTDKATVMAITPSTPEPDKAFAGVKESLKTVKAKFEVIRNDIRGIRQVLRGEKATTSATPSAQPSSATNSGTTK